MKSICVLIVMSFNISVDLKFPKYKVAVEGTVLLFPGVLQGRM